MQYKLSTEDVNSYGFWVLTAGIDLTRYEMNPVITVMHKKKRLSVGKMTNLRVENNILTGEPEFDNDDKIGAALARKYEKGYMNGFSVSLKPITFTNDKQFVKPGQFTETLISSELIEVAAATVPSNAYAVRLSDMNNNEINLSADIPKLNTQKKMDEKTLIELGLESNSTENDVLLKVKELKAENSDLKAQKLAFETVENERKNREFEELLSNPQKAFTDEQKTNFRELAAKDRELAVKAVRLTPDVKSLHTVPNSESDKGGQENLSFSELQKTNPQKLAELKANNTEEFRRLYVKEFGKEPKL